MSGEVDLLVVGAGPTGLTTALVAHELGASVRIVERRSDAHRVSRALIVHPRTLEVLRPFRVSDDLLEAGEQAPRARLHLSRHELEVTLGGFALADTAFPALLFVRQAVVETVLIEALAARGVPIERGAELVGARLGDGGVEAELERGSAGGRSRAWCRYLAGCDGPTSTVRAVAGIGTRGRPYASEAVLADVELRGDLAPGVLHAAVARGGLVLVFALGEGATWRLLATRPARGSGPPGSVLGGVPADELQELLTAARLPVRLEAVAGAWRIGLHRRLAEAYRAGPIFLAGDAAHVHSPAGGQGMNTGIQDGVNLAWKLAFAAAHARAGAPEQGREVLLSSYEQERRSLERRVLALTHAIFWAEAGTGVAAGVLRARLAPLGAPVLPRLLASRRLVAAGVRVLSQLSAHYRASPLSTRSGPPLAGRPRPGERLGDGPARTGAGLCRLHDLTARPGVHLLLARDAPPLEAGLVGPLVHLHRLRDHPGTEVLVVRPDGYVGHASSTGSPVAVRAWLGLAAVPGTGGS